MIPDNVRLFKYVEGFFARATKRDSMWPTVRRAARSLGWTQQRVQSVVMGDHSLQLQLTGFVLDKLGDRLVESYGDETEIPS
jgi:hypothetical protein